MKPKLLMLEQELSGRTLAQKEEPLRAALMEQKPDAAPDKTNSHELHYATWWHLLLCGVFQPELPFKPLGTSHFASSRPGGEGTVGEKGTL